MFIAGQRIRNKNTNVVWTVIAVNRIGNKTVWEIANAAFSTIRFNQDYVQHYEIVEEEK
jgi:DNA-directed RNA polymerase specialized sigma54-like protein